MINCLWEGMVTSYYPFLPYDAMLVRYMLLSCVCMCMCLSVCVSITLRYCIKTDKLRITQSSPYDSLGTLVFLCQLSRWNSNGGTKNKWSRLGFVILCISIVGEHINFQIFFQDEHFYSQPMDDKPSLKQA